MPKTRGPPRFTRYPRFPLFRAHTIWHLFVLGGSFMHFLCDYNYILPFPYDGDALPLQRALDSLQQQQQQQQQAAPEI